MHSKSVFKRKESSISEWMIMELVKRVVPITIAELSRQTPNPSILYWVVGVWSLKPLKLRDSSGIWTKGVVVAPGIDITAGPAIVYALVGSEVLGTSLQVRFVRPPMEEEDHLIELERRFYEIEQETNPQLVEIPASRSRSSSMGGPLD